MNALVTSDLAAGFAANAAGWAGNRGAPADSIEALKIAAACVGDATQQGSACVPLSAIVPHIGDKTVADLRAALLASRIVSTPDSVEVLPLVLDSANRLYLRRYFDYERRLATNLLRFATPGGRPRDAPPARNHQRRTRDRQDDYGGAAARADPRGEPGGADCACCPDGQGGRAAARYVARAGSWPPRESALAPAR
jgi:hypothetical protein